MSPGRKRNRGFDGAALKTWRETMGLAQREAALLMRTSLRGYQQWEGGEAAIPGPVPLACAAISFGLRLVEA